MKTYNTGLVVGRFQPFHKGHIYLLKKALEKADKIIIAVGSSNTHDANNPLDFKTRVRMLEKVIAEEGLKNKISSIIPSPDHPNDNIWLKKLLKLSGTFDIAIGNNDWTNDILERAGNKVFRLPHYRRDLYQGYLVRQLFEKRKNWQSRIPPYLVGFIKKEFSTLNI